MTAHAAGRSGRTARLDLDEIAFLCVAEEVGARSISSGWRRSTGSMRNDAVVGLPQHAKQASSRFSKSLMTRAV